MMYNRRFCVTSYQTERYLEEQAWSDYVAESYHESERYDDDLKRFAARGGPSDKFWCSPEYEAGFEAHEEELRNKR